MARHEVFFENPIQGSALDPAIFRVNASGGGAMLQGVYGEANRVNAPNGGAARQLVSLIEDGQGVTDCEVAVEVIQMDGVTGVSAGAGARCDNAASASISCYLAGISGNAGFALFLWKYVNGVNTAIATIPNTKGITPTTGYCVKLKCQGTAIKAKFWLRGTEEPMAWDIEATDTSLSAGTCGLCSINPGTYRFGKMSIGTGADTAPPLSFKIAGNVRDTDNSPVARTVRAYERTTGRLQGEVVSNASTGNFDMFVNKSQPLYYIVALDALAGTKNAIIKDRLVPFAG